MQFPLYSIVLKCNFCDNYSHYYIYHNGDIMCRGCFAKRINAKTPRDGVVYYFKDDIQDYQNTYCQKLTEFQKNSNYKFPKLSEKYLKFRGG